MKNKYVVFLFLFSNVALAQKVTIKGQLTDSLGALPSATVLLLQQKDSSLVQFGVSNADGLFEIRNISRGDYLFKATFVGYAPYMKKIMARPEEGPEINLGQIRMRPKSKELKEVVVKGEKDPVVVKRDTIEFNASSFKVKVNATVEDLLKKLPSVEVDNDGTIRAQGEQVQRVMVDGKEFFGQDPKLATRNLPADAVDKVQVFDKKSDQAIFSGIDDGQRQKSINLELKEEKRHAAFGNDMAGVGTDNRFQAKASVNRFDKGNQFSFLGMGNNINEQGFSFGDYANFSGAATGGGGVFTLNANNNTGVPLNTGRQNGIVTNYAGGLNTNRGYNNDKTKVNASYFYNRLDQNLITNLHRINYLPIDSSSTNTYNFDQYSVQKLITDNHRGNLTIEHKIDSVNSLKFNANVAYTLSDQNLISTAKTMNIGNTALQNENQRNTTSNGSSATLNSFLLLRHRFAKKGRTISANLSFAYGDSETKGTLLSNTTTYEGTSPTTIPANQRSSLSTTSPSYGVTLSYTEPLGGRRYLEVNYNFSTDINNVDKQVYNMDSYGNGTLNQSLTNKYYSNYLYNRPGLNFRMNREKFNLTVGTALQETHLHGNLVLKNEIIDRQFQAVLPVVHFNYDFTNFKRLRFDYTTNMQEPTVQQLQPIVDNSDPLNLAVGNPQLRPAYAHQVRSNFTFFDPAKFMNLFALISANYTANAITSSQSVDSSLVRTTKPVNVRNSMNLNGNFNVGVPVKALNSRFNLGPNYSGSSGINLINDIENTISQQTVGGTARYNYSLGEILIVDLSATVSHQETKYSFNTQQNQTYFNKTYTAEVNVNFLKNYAYNTEMDYFIYNSTTTDYHQAIPLWNMSVSRFMLKNKSGELRLSVNNILDYGISVTQTATSNYLQQQTNNNLGRFYMISFTFAMNKQLNPMGAGERRRGGGPRMMMIRQ